MFPNPRIVISAESDNVAASALIPSARHQRFKLRTGMQNGNITIADRLLRLDNGDSIYVRSTNGQDTIFINAPRNEKIEPYVRYKVAFVTTSGFKGDNLVNFYDVKYNLVKSIKITLDEYFDEYDTLHDPNFVGSKGIIFIDFHSWVEEIDSVAITVYPYINDDSHYPESFYSGWGIPKRIPILKQKYAGRDITPLSWTSGYTSWQPDTFLDVAWKNTTVEENYTPREQYMTKTGFMLYAKINHSSPGWGGYTQSVGSSEFLARGLYGEIGPLFRVVQAYDVVPMAHQHQPESWNHRAILCMCPSAYGSTYIMAVAVFDTSGFIIDPNTGVSPWSGDRYHNEGDFVEAFIGSIPVSFFNRDDMQIFFWREDYESDYGGVISHMTKLVELTKNEYYQLKRVECYNNRMYVFSDSSEGNRLIPSRSRDYYFSSWPDLSQVPKVDVYSLATETLGTKLLTKEFDNKYFDPPCLVEYPENLITGPIVPVFCFRTRTSKFDGRSEIQVYDALTLERKKLKQVGTLPDKQTAIINIPRADRLIELINELRSEQEKVERNEGSSIEYRPYVGLCGQLSDMALAHLTWCLSEGVMQHEDENGDMIDVWGPKQGVFACTDNIALIPTTGNIFEDLNTAFQGWKASPRHFDNMVAFDVTSAGWAMVLIPEGTTSFTVGPGAHQPDGSYSTGDTTLELSSISAMFQLILAA